MNYTMVNIFFVRDLSIIWICVYVAAATLVYFIKESNGALNKENFIVFLCASCTLAFSIVYFLFDSQFTVLKTSKLTCDVASMFWKTFLILNRCFCNLIFSYRYIFLNKNSKVLAAQRSHVFTVSLIFVSFLLLVFDIIYYQVQISPFVFGCENFNINYDEHYIGINFEVCLFLIAVGLQTAILVEIIKPIYKHCRRLSNSTISNASIRNTLYRVVLCTLFFCISELGFSLAYFLGINIVNERWPLLWAINLLVNTLSLMCSFKDYKKRLYPFFKNSCDRKNSAVVRPVNQPTNTNSFFERSNLNNTISTNISI